MSDFGLYRTKKSKSTLVGELMKVPSKESKINMPKRDPRFIENGYTHQADLLYLPEDPDGFKYALVVVDLGSGICDAEPLKTKTQAEVLTAFQTLYKRDNLDIPKALLQIDNGTEFNGPVAKWFSDNKVMIRRGKPDRHRQQANVEAYNGTIARAIFYDLHEKELKSKQTERAWIKNLPIIINLINKHMKKVKQAEKKKPVDMDVRCEGDSCMLLQKGTKVRRILDAPNDPGTDTRLKGKFRKTDTRWENEVRTVTKIILHPAQPPMYGLSGLKNVLYTKPQLQVVKDKESLATPQQPEPEPQKPQVEPEPEEPQAQPIKRRKRRTKQVSWVTKKRKPRKK